MPIAVDAMGGDFYPKSPVAGAVQAIKDQNIDVILVGDEPVIKKELDNYTFDSKRIEIAHAAEVVEMDDPIVTALKGKRQSSLRICFDLHKNGQAGGVVSAGHSGAMLAIGRFVLKTIPGIDRPCISALLPSKNFNVLLLDAGANIDCAPENLLQFALLGSVYLEQIYSVDKPKIGLLNIGVEEGKGDEIRKQAYSLLKDSSLNFVGNIEGKEFFEGEIDVVVTDGFAGNILLKSVQGAADFLKKIIRNEINQSLLTKLGALCMKPALSRLKKRTNYAEFGGAPLLGLKGNAIVCHGSSNAQALAYGIRFAHWSYKMDLVNQIQQKIAEHREILENIA